MAKRVLIKLFAGLNTLLNVSTKRQKSVAWMEEQVDWLKIKDPQLVKLIIMLTEYILCDQCTIIPPEQEQQFSDGEQDEPICARDKETVAPQLFFWICILQRIRQTLTYMNAGIKKCWDQGRPTTTTVPTRVNV